jgi:hypothetical protein
MAVIVRLLAKDELPLANNFFNHIYNTNRSIEAFNWEFVTGPFGQAIYLAAIDTDFKNEIKIVGIQCAIPLMMITSSGEKILTAKSEDTLVDTNYRGQDIFNKMYDLLFDECKNADIKYIWGFTPAYKPFVKLGFNLDFKAQQGLFVLKPIGAYRFFKALNPKNKVKDKIKIFVLQILSKLITAKNSFVKKTAYRTSISNIFNSQLIIKNNFHLSSNTSLFLYEDDKYFKWRISDNKYLNHYQNIDFIDKSGVVCANVIINKRNNIGYVEQILFDKNVSTDDKKSIVKETINQLKHQGVDAIRFLAFDANYTNKTEIEILKSIGFVILKRGTWFVWKSLDENYSYPSESVLLSRLYTQGNN